ncbi:SDR family NAD(P)-dependent oxidoreductase [Aquabacter spiritensis]|uniref:NAD(P)-dependent dehydrogenase (Short-subunit alcohol dehydrogenase family) n=1 Tax=Aquabacter spiritensis TaxID=933073 RepID=A0A4R3LVC3_9HYPH|nr:SDR family NAD(P)-dependent oxidoreductase [Aquabacter spiritensis]TCT03996.1 NAD(P)-dependent dehydrogenase (short-subunit alcohol dehydrogenase family) [Aquabacter spiritensis]
MPDHGSVLVTGGASGIGLALVEDLLKAGWRVVAADVSEANLAATQAALAGHGNALRVLQLDVTDEPAVVETVAAVDRDFGPLRGVVNCAGIARDVPALDTSADLFRKILDVNLVGTFVVAREAARAMKANGGGSIVNIASVSGQRGNLGRSAYGSSKAGVILLTQVMAVELAADNVRVNAVAPGPIETPLVKALHTNEARAAWMRTVPMKRYAAPGEVAGAIAFLLDGTKSGFVTGQTLGVDGGFAAGGLIGQ